VPAATSPRSRQELVDHVFGLVEPDVPLELDVGPARDPVVDALGVHGDEHVRNVRAGGDFLADDFEEGHEVVADVRRLAVDDVVAGRQLADVAVLRHADGGHAVVDGFDGAAAGVEQRLGKPSIVRAEHLSAIRIPMLFIQGTRDKLADTALLACVTKSLGRRAAVHLIDHADHAFHVPARSGRTVSDVVSEIAEAFASWITRFSP
jgi:pimeloyl-ACP methyl ester carboxylesterase